MGRKHVREKRRKTDAEKLAELPRAKPTVDRIKHSRGWRAMDGITVRVTAVLPSAVLRMQAKGTLSDAQCRAAEIFMADHEQGYGSAISTTAYRERVQGGAVKSDYVDAARLDARIRYESARGALPRSIRDIVIGVLINEVSLSAVGDYPKRYNRAETRRTCAATLLGIGLLFLAENYGLTSTHKEV